jgi:CRISPR-associated endoribonuclease Cas6
MPARMVVPLQPVNGRPKLPPHTGPAVSAALLAAVRDSGLADLANAMHNLPPPKPYALTPLLDERDRPASPASRSMRFEIGVLADELVAPLLGVLHNTRTMRLANCELALRQPELTAAQPYPSLATEATENSGWTLTILTPAAFATSRGEGARRLRPLPQPEWVFRSLLSRWTALAGGGLLPDNDLAVAIEQHLTVEDLQLKMAEHLVKAGQPTRRGVTGTITYRLAGAGKLTPPVRIGLDALMRFATYAGIGDRTSVGMGHVRLADKR